MKHFYTKFLTMAVLVMSTLSAMAIDYQLPNSGMDEWNGPVFDNKPQLTSWQASNVQQSIVTQNFITKGTGRTKSCAVIENQQVGVSWLGITENCPGYFTLGSPWQYVPGGTDSNNATGGTDGGIDFSPRPDSMYVWIKRDGQNPAGENYSILFYSWKGTSKGDKYRSKDKKACTSTSHTNEESDIRQAMDANDCTTTTSATQIAEGFWFEKKAYSSWTQIKVPIYYLNDNVPEKCNVIFSSSGYPNYRNADGIVVGNKLYVDDVQLIYSSKIQQLYIGGKQWKGFDPNSTEEQTYSVGHTTDVPDIYAVRGAGTMKNIKGNTVAAPGRKLSGDEITINYGQVDGAPTVITVKAADGSSTTTYKIKMVQAASENATLASILVNDNPIAGFNPQLGSYDVALPYGTTAAPVVSVVKAEDKQTVDITQATSPTGKASILVTAADGKTKKTYTVNFSVAKLADNTLKGIKVNGEEIADFTPSLTIYTVELPLGTATMPTVEAISAYPAGAQTIVYTAPDKIDGGQYKISVTTPGNQTAKVYKLNFVITASTNSKLKDLQMEGYDLGFSSNKLTYYVTLPMGTTKLPKITCVKGDPYQTVDVKEGGVDGTTTITVTAASGAQTKYSIICKTEKSEASNLTMIYIDGVALEGFNQNTTSYTYPLTPGTTELPAVTWDAADEYETVNVSYGGLNGTTKITVTAGDGVTTTIYKITFSLELNANVTLDNIYLDNKPLEGFESTTYVYLVILPKGTEELPAVTWKEHDATQVVTPRYGGVNGDTKITVRAQTGATAVYTLQFRVQKDSINTLEMIYVDGKQLDGFHKDTLNYIDSLPVGVSKIPAVKWTLSAESATAKLLNQGNQRTIRVTAEDGSIREYTITFIISKSESAFPKMIYVDGQPLPGFDPKELEYAYEFDGDVAPEITVEKEGNQQVIILAPVGVGVATIIVSPEGGGEGNTYIINLRQKPKAAVQLVAIQLDGLAMEGFSPDKLDYTIDYSNVMPVATCTAAEGQTVNMFSEKNVIRFVVTSDGEQAVYTLKFNQLLSADATLAAILLNGEALAGYDPAKLNYDITLPAGSSVPEIGYTPGNAAQVITLGQTGDKTFAINVHAEDGITTATYTLAFTIEQFTTTELEALTLDGTPLALEEGVYTYNRTIDAGAELPELGITPGGGQTILTVNTSETQQQIIVKSEDGHTATYTINYTPVYSSEAQLDSILLDGTPLKDFAPGTYNYTHTLPWRTEVVPVIRPVGATPNQTIEIHYGAVNAQTQIHVIAADKTATADYYINFPVTKSDNVALQGVMFEDVDFDFDAETTDYEITLPYQSTAVPAISYFKSEPEQTIKYVSAPLSGTTQLIVTAENGDQRTYNFTFKVAQSDKQNILNSLIFNTNKQSDVEHEITAAEQESGNITLNLPYGTTELAVGFVKNYDEQAVLVQPGGIFNPTIITVKANRGDEADKVYTVTPNIKTQNPAVLNGITVNGVALAGFDKNRFSYVMDLSSAGSIPSVTYTKEDGVSCNTPTQNIWCWTIKASAEGFSNSYTIYFHYPNEAIPNYHFTDWVKNDKNTADKPNGWRVTNDYITGYNSADYVTKNSATRVQLYNHGSGTLDWAWSNYGCAPAVMNLTGMAVNHTVSGGSRTKITNGEVAFHNTPDKAEVNFAYPTVDADGKGAIIRFHFKDNDGTVYNYDIKQTSKKTSFSTASVNLPIDGKQITGYDIIFDAACAILNDGKGAVDAKMQIDWVKFIYSSALSKIKVNDGSEIAPSDKKFTYTLPSAETTGVPALTFIGAVSDQAQKVAWDTTDPKALKRTATVTNYAEDGTSTTYTVEVNRPKSQVATLADLKVNGMTVTGWTPEVTEYKIPVAVGQKRLYDVQALRGSNLQTIALTVSGDTVKVNVVAENDTKQKEYRVIFEEQKSNDVTLAGIACSGVDYDPAVTEYAISAAAMPDIKFVKNSDGQTVTLDGGKLCIVAEDGVSKDTITITNTPPAVVTNGQLNDLLLDGVSMEGFDASTYTYSKPQPFSTAFEREFATDTVWQTITPDSLTWLVKGTEQHTYSIVYPTTVSAEAVLSMILINGEPLEGFNTAETEYEIRNSEPIRIEVVAKPGQAITTSVTVEPINAAPGRQKASAQPMGLRYTLEVKAQNAINTLTYTISVLPAKSSDATLKMIRLDGADLAGFDASTTRYVVTLPTTNPKLAEPKMPSVAYLANQYAQTIALETSQENDTTYNYITVTSEDGLSETLYELLITAEPSHNAQITALMLDGEMIEDFSPERTNYSSWVNDLNVDIAYSATDRFLTIDTTMRKDVLTLHVVAQDKVTKNDYTVKLYQRAVSTDVTLANILLNGQSFTDYDAALTPFTPMNSYYNIPISGSQTIPDVRPILNSNDQTAEIDKSHGDTVLITVHAADGVHSNTYMLNFNVQKSSDIALAKLEVGDSLLTLVPGQLNYTFVLPVGEKVPRAVTFELQNYELQSYENEDVEGMTWSADVIAEDGTRATYTVTFIETLSQNALLSDITANEVTIDGFTPDQFYYEIQLPQGERTLPAINFYEGDDWQREQAIDTIATKLSTTYKCTVLAEDSIHRNIYTVKIDIMPSDVDTLAAIMVNNRLLEGFDPYKMSYDYTLPAGTTELPKVEFEQGDMYQTVDSVSTGVNGTMTILVTAENGSQRRYSINFIVERNSDATLASIACGGKDLEDFDAGTYDYIINLPYGTTTIPVITYTKADPKQEAAITVTDNVVTITVTAENGAQLIYTLTFIQGKSTEAHLESITVGGEPLKEFEAETFEYTITLPYGTTEMPEVTAALADTTAAIEIANEGQTVTISTLSADGRTPYEYIITFVIEGCPINYLTDLLVKGATIEGFHQDSTIYTLAYPVGTDSTSFVHAEDVTYVVGDATEEVTVSEEHGTIYINVKAQNGDVRVYAINQIIRLNNNSLLADLTINGTTVAQFGDSVFNYEYLLFESEIVTVEAVAQDSLAEVSVTMGDTTYVYCTAQDGSESVYQIVFRISPINTALPARPADVLFKQVGPDQFAAYTIRNNTSIAIYDQYGHLFFNQQLPVCNPNDVVVSTDPMGQDVLIDANGDAAYIDLPAHGQTFFYLFYSNNEHITSGKFFVQ